MGAVGQKQIALMIAARTKDSTELPADVMEAMTTLVTLGALDAVESDPDGALSVDPDHPGYLRRDVAGKVIFVPFHLAKVSPGADLLAEVITLAKMIQLDSSNPICISGSTTFMGSLNVVADLDFCEYFLLPCTTFAASLVAASEIGDLPLVVAKFAGNEYHQPWDCLSSVGQAFCATPAWLKLDFMSCGKLGPMPTTSVILPTTDGEDGAAEKSFAYQEAVIGAAAPLRILIAPARFGAYLRFLKKEARDYVTKSKANAEDAIKALKRLLALKSALGDREEVDAIVTRLNRPEIEEMVQRKRLKELVDMQPHLPVDAPQRFNDQIEALRNAPSSANATDVAEALAAARDLAAALLDEVERDFAEYA